MAALRCGGSAALWARQLLIAYAMIRIVQALGGSLLLIATATSCRGMQLSLRSGAQTVQGVEPVATGRAPVTEERLETLSGVADAVRAFERAVRWEKAEPGEAVARSKAIAEIQACTIAVGNVTVQAYFKPYAKRTTNTSVGPLTLPDMQSRCEAASERLWATPVDGCGVRKVEITSINLGAGQWSRPELYPSRSYEPVACTELPAVKAPPAQLRELVEPVVASCKKSPTIQFNAGDWKVRPVASGHIMRSLTALCFLKGTYSDWGATPQ